METEKILLYEKDKKISNIIIEKITDILNEIVNMNVHVLNNNIKCPFICYPVPQISVKKYMERLRYYTKMEKSTLILSLIYIDRICEKNKLKLNQFNIHKILLGAILAAIKFNEDKIYKNSYYSKAAGISLNEINNLEIYTLFCLDFNLYVSTETYKLYHDYLFANDSFSLKKYKQ